MVKKKKAIAKKKGKIKIVTPVGRLSYPYLLEPDEGRENSDDKYKTDLLIPKDTWKKEGQALKEAVLKVGREFYKDKSLELKDFANPFKDTDKIKKYSKDKDVLGNILIRCKSEFQPIVLDAGKEELSERQIKSIKGGDYARLVVAVYPYSNGEGGVTLGLNVVQFVKSGPALGGGKAAVIAQLDEIEIDADDIDLDEEDEDDEEEVAPKKSPKKKAKPVVEEDDEEEEEEESDDEPEDDEEEDSEVEDEEESDDDDFSFDDSDEEDEEEAPKKKSAKKPVKASKAPAKKAGKKSKASDDDDEF